ncbi:hypothetical protein [Planomonospora venezuelensis]|uniref:Lipoprotein n=2 Tax=Planomonospora venezuelensis TaxID=1999 RepID=A0A841D045_PLAVE|nr:hypothetical protein [Planomonospora venezuelensis]MBB5961555.1 hypothetical protein [Planomonospora venezuelensis]
MIACVAAATAAASVAAAPVQAASADPVKALKSQLVAGRGVKFTDVSSLVSFTGTTSFLKRTGSFQFGRAGIAASDVSAGLTADEPSGMPPSIILPTLEKPERTIRIGTTSYYSGGPWAPPKGKTWVKHRNGMSAGFSGTDSQMVNAAEPGTLKLLIAKGKREGRTYSGAISLGALEKVSPWLQHVQVTGMSESTKKDVVRFRLTLGPGLLPQRLVTVYPSSHVSAAVGEDRKISVETRYTGWGSRVTVKAPPASKTVDAGKGEPTVRGGGRG